MSISQEQIFAEVKKAVIETLQLSSELPITPETSMVKDLGAESLDFLDIAFRLEQHFNIQLLKDDIITKASEVLGSDLIIQNGTLTEVGAELLRRRMSEVDPTQIKAGLPVREISSFFTINTWVRAVHEVLNAKPIKCPQCNSKELVSKDKAHVVCKSCNITIQVPTGDDLAKEWILKTYQEIQSQR